MPKRGKHARLLPPHPTFLKKEEEAQLALTSLVSWILKEITLNPNN